MVIVQLAMISILNILELHKMKPWQWKSCHNSSGFVKKHMDSFVRFLHHSNQFANPPSCITALYTKNTVSISIRCSLQIRKTSDVSMPSQLTPNVWILTTAPAALTTKITLICPGETTQFIEVWKSIHTLQLPMACSAISLNFHIPPCYENSTLEVNISLDMANLNMINISAMNFYIWQHMEQHWNDSQLQHLASIPTVPVGQFYATWPQAFNTSNLFSPEESTGDTDLPWTLFSHTGVYVMAIGSLITAGLGIFCCYFFWC